MKFLKKYKSNFIPFVTITCVYLVVVFLFAIQYEEPLAHLCLYKNISGLPCPGCGLTRSYLTLIDGNLKGAFFFHPLFFTIPFILILIFFTNLTSKAFHKKTATYFLFGFIALFLVVYVLRMVTFFPHTPPMDFNNNALIPIFLKFVHSFVM
ncbi:MAG: DUF2752 domain-containing protein [Vallitaleaceae bacterium]|nr:DUF2752 domain-containing protein [Vallitaleaceae bacterium]